MNHNKDPTVWLDGTIPPTPVSRPPSLGMRHTAMRHTHHSSFPKFMSSWTQPWNTKGGKHHCTIDLLFDWFVLVCLTNKNKNCQLSYSWFQTSQTGGQWYSDTSPLVFPDLAIPPQFMSSHNSLLFWYFYIFLHSLEIFTYLGIFTYFGDFYIFWYFYIVLVFLHSLGIFT
jgi:hypothetical protein